MKKLPLLALALLSLSFVACDKTIETPNGEIPSEYAAQVQQYMGSFHGQLEMQENDLSFSMDGNKVVLSSRKDLLQPICQSKIGAMKNFSYAEDKGAIQVTSAEFDFNANLCSTNFYANSMTIYFVDKNVFEVSMLEKYDRRQVCDGGGVITNPPPAPPTPIPPSCRTEYSPVYWHGKFLRTRN